MLAWALGRPADWAFSVGHLCAELGLNDYRWRVVRQELAHDGWLIQHRENEPLDTDAWGNVTSGGFRWTLTFTDAPLVEAIQRQSDAPDDTTAITPTSRSLNTTDAMPEHTDEAVADEAATQGSHYHANGSHKDANPAGSHDEATRATGSHFEETGSCNRAISAHNGAMSNGSQESATPIRRNSTDGGATPYVDFPMMGNSTDGTPYISNQDDDDDVEPPKPPGSTDRFSESSNPPAPPTQPPGDGSDQPPGANPDREQSAGGGVSQSADASTEPSATMPVGQITDRITAEGFRMTQVISNRFLARIRDWQAKGLTAHELERAMAMAHANLAEGRRPGSPFYYDWAVEKIIAEREAKNQPIPTNDTAEPAANATAGRSERSNAQRRSSSPNKQRKDKGFDHATAHPKPVDETRYGGIRPEAYIQRRTEAQKQRERDSFGFCVEDFEGDNAPDRRESGT